MRIIPVGDSIYLEVLPMREEQGLIKLPEVHSERTRKAVVRAIGDEVKKYKVGDKVLISYFTGTHLHLFELNAYDKPDLHRMVRQDAILAKYEDEG